MARAILTIDDLSKDEIETIFDLADGFLHDMAVGGAHKIVGRAAIGQSHVLSTLFFEPSTRTRFSFESAMLRLGGHILSSADPATTSAAKGESIADMVRVIQSYADIIVIRHPFEGAARVAADFTDVPVINAGDGSHEHPTQTLCDLYTLRKENKSLKDLNVLIRGDLKNGRTVHSLVYGLARFGAHIIPYSAAGLELPNHVTRRLEREYHCVPMTPPKDLPVDAVYVTSDGPRQLQLLPGFDISIKMRQIDVCYVTRLQVERLNGGDKTKYPRVDKDFLRNKRYRKSTVLHPLPRVSELGYDMDSDPRGIYFKQASYGVPVRMALISALLKLKGTLAPARHERKRVNGSYSLGVQCPNPTCVTNQDTEKRYLTPTFWIIPEPPLILRCRYCENEIQPGCVGNKSTRRFDTDLERIDSIPSVELIFFLKTSDAINSGFTPYQRRASSRTSQR